MIGASRVSVNDCTANFVRHQSRCVKLVPADNNNKAATAREAQVVQAGSYRIGGALALMVILLGALGGCSTLGFGHKPLNELKARYETKDSRYVDIDGTEVHYRIEGNLDGPTLLLIHAVTASLQTWDGWVDNLKDNYRIVRLDMPGCGLTGPFVNSDDYSPEALEHFLAQFIDKVGLDHFDLAGNSQGAMVAWMYAIKHPDHVDKMVLIQPIAYPQKLPQIIDFITMPVIRDIGYVMAPKFLVTTIARQVYGDPDRLNDRIIDRYFDLEQRKGNRVAMLKTLVQLRHISHTEKYARMVPLIKVPTMIEWGEKDNFLPRAVLERWHHDLPKAPIVIYPWGGHITMEEVPMQTSRDADRFFSGLPIKSNMWIESTEIQD